MKTISFGEMRCALNIKEVAKLAGVSTSTVSKVINGKDDSIRGETRQRVLEIVKNCGYTPYSGVKSIPKRSFLLGLLVPEGAVEEAFLSGVLTMAEENGYQIIVSLYRNGAEEAAQMSALCAKKVDGVLWQRSFAGDGAARLQDAGIPVLTCDGLDTRQGCKMDEELLACAAAGIVLGLGHVRVACLTGPDDSPQRQDFCTGYRRAFFERKAAYDGRWIMKWDGGRVLSDLISWGVTAVVCYDEFIAADLYRQAKVSRIAIPEELSVVAVAQEQGRGAPDGMIPPLTAVERPSRELGARVCEALVRRIEKREAAPDGTMIAFPHPKVRPGNSVARPPGARGKKIVVVGSLNADTLVDLARLPSAGETMISESWRQFPGGKGANQAAAAAKLGGDVSLIGCVGRDHDAVMLFHTLAECGVHLQGVRSDDAESTGKAFICVREDGESSIVVHAGANGRLSLEDVRSNEDAFRGASFCLLQTESPAPVVTCAARYAARHGVRVILKPSAVRRISGGLLRDTSILLPNERELSALVPGDANPLEDHMIEEKARVLLERGVKTVVVTLGPRGCCLCTRDRCAWFSALDCPAADTTGAADAFAAALAVSLCEREDLDMAIRLAVVAAGLSTRKAGAQSALADRAELEGQIQRALRISVRETRGGRA